VYGDPAKITSDLVDRYYELALREGNRQALGQRLRQMKPGGDASRVDTIKLPTLILWGGRDKLVPVAAGREFQTRIVGSQLVVFDDLGHVPQEEDPARNRGARSGLPRPTLIGRRRSARHPRARKTPNQACASVQR
jgi:pimeloyl-ACP methyl ester carboxylesterase